MCVVCYPEDYDDECSDDVCDDICDHISYIPETLIKLKGLLLHGANTIVISDKLVKLDYIACISGMKISFIPNTLINLTSLICIETGLKYIPDELINLKHIDCPSNEIEYIPDTLVNLEYLNCYNNKIKCIPNTLVNLTYLDCSENEIYDLPYTLTKLIKLKIKENAFEYLPNTFINLEHLNISNSTILEIPSSFINLKKIVMEFDDYNYNENVEWFYILYISLKKLIKLEYLISFGFKRPNSIYFAIGKDEVIEYINSCIIIYGLYFPETVKEHHKYIKKETKNNLFKYVELITDNYLNPKSSFIKYISEQFYKKRNNEIGYLNSNNELKIFKLKNNLNIYCI
jgi:Leucine-rich repeat (LRR) protein